MYGPASSSRFRNPSTSSSSSAAIADTCDLDRPTTPREAASFSTRRVETPSRYDVATTEASARSARRRCSRNAGKYDPCRSFGIASSIVPARVSHSRRRYPLREFTRSVVTSPYPALQRTSTSASIIRCANSRIISRSTSGLADARVSSNCAPGTGTMSPTATSLSFVSTTHFEGSRGGRLPSRRHAVLREDSHISTGYPIHHFRGREHSRRRRGVSATSVMPPRCSSGSARLVRIAMRSLRGCRGERVAGTVVADVCAVSGRDARTLACSPARALCGHEPLRQLAPLAKGLVMGLGRVSGHRNGNVVGSGLQLPGNGRCRNLGCPRARARRQGDR